MSRFLQLILLAVGAYGVSGECDITGLLQQAAVRPHSEHSSADKELFVLIHIPKTGGTSEAKDGPLVVAPHTFIQNPETALKATHHFANQVDVINLRLPIDHVLSQFLQCKYGFAHRHHSSSFPTGPNVLDGFEEWTRHFVELKSTKDDSSFLNSRDWAEAQVYNLTGCYNPWNMQTRYLATTWGHTAILKVLEPDLEEAKKNLKHIREHGVLGITELYVESLCMLHLRAHGTVPSTCQCGGPGPVQGGPHHETREVPKHNASSLSPELLERMHTLTHMDIQLYAVALDFFEQDLLDASEKTGVQMVCKSSFDNLWARVHQMHQQIGVPFGPSS